MKSKISLFIMVDACGWEIVKNDPFCQRVAPHRHKLESVFGYSSTCVPSIVSGRWPDEHRNWCYFVHDPEKSPFRFPQLVEVAAQVADRAQNFPSLADARGQMVVGLSKDISISTTFLLNTSINLISPKRKARSSRTA